MAMRSYHAGGCERLVKEELIPRLPTRTGTFDLAGVDVALRSTTLKWARDVTTKLLISPPRAQALQPRN